ncbi:peptidoglycan D,D-transpeptidase FtsI family protein [Blautia stercoris]
MNKNRVYHKKKTVIVFFSCLFLLTGLIVRMVYLMVIESDYYAKKAQTLHERERDIKAERGKIIDAKGEVLADNKAVCTISVIHSQIKEPEKVIAMLKKELGLSEETARKRVEKRSSIERIKTNVEKETGDRIREYGLDGVKVDEDFKRYYPYQELASKVLGFTGADNQGIIGLEVQYDDFLKGTDGKILTVTDARGVELEKLGESRREPIAGYDLHVSLDKNIQMYAQQAAEKVMEEKEADAVSILFLNPQNGEIYADVNVPEFNLNEPFMLGEAEENLNQKEKQDALNRMWRNLTVNDTYEPGSTFKIITMAAGLSEGVVTPNDRFSCPGFKVVEDRRIHCHKRSGHGAEDFVQGAMNSCNPVFIEVGLRLGVERYYHYFKQFGLLKKTGIDIPGEAGTIMHKEANIGQVELATISFGQSFQITPIQLVTTVSSIINGGRRITPHFGVYVTDETGKEVKRFEYPVENNIVTEEVSKEVREILEKVVSEGSGKNAFIEGHTIGGKTATSQTLPRSKNRYISSFLGFTPADEPEIIGICLIHDPTGIYYGGTIAAPVIRDIYENILPYLGIEG